MIELIQPNSQNPGPARDWESIDSYNRALGEYWRTKQEGFLPGVRILVVDEALQQIARTTDVISTLET